MTHVLRGWSATIIGGTGLCCWNHSLDIVIFGDYLDTFGTPIVGRGALIYLDGAGRVIQANVVSGRRGPITCHDHMRVDSRGAQVGSLCFDYATAIPWGSLLGGHQPYLEGPGVRRGGGSGAGASVCRADRRPAAHHLHRPRPNCVPGGQRARCLPIHGSGSLPGMAPWAMAARSNAACPLARPIEHNIGIYVLTP